MKEDLITYSMNAASLRAYRECLCRLESALDVLDDEIDEVDAVTADALAIVRNEIDGIRIGLAMRANKAERKMLEFENFRRNEK